LLFMVVLSSCATSLFVVYETEMTPSTFWEGTESVFEDSRFVFSFIPSYNGIFFSIKNKTDHAAYIIWDRTYFIQPNGNSYKAVNTDILITSRQIAEKEQYETVIPPRASVARFTTSTTNLGELTYEQAQMISNQLRTAKTPDSMASIISSDSVLFGAGQFWPSHWKVQNLGFTTEVLEEKGDQLLSYLRDNDNLGVGFYIMHQDEPLEYRFDFRFAGVGVYGEEQIIESVEDSDAQKVTTQVHLLYMAFKENDWEWREIRRPHYLKEKQTQ
jgi:hypothetical protein